MVTVLKIIADAHAPDARLAKEIKSLVKNGYKVDVICWDRDGLKHLSSKENNRHGDVIRMKSGMGRGSSIKFLIRLIKFYLFVFEQSQRRDFRIIHVHSLQVLPIGILLKILRRKVLVYDVHEITETFGTGIHKNVGRVVTVVERFLLKWVNGVVTVSEALEERYKEYSNGRIPVVTLRNCLDLNVTNFKKYLCDNLLVIGRIGNLRARSRLDMIADIICKMNELGYPTKFYYAGQNIGGYESVSTPANQKMGEYAQYQEWIALEEFKHFYDKVDLIINIHERGDRLEEKFAYFSKVFEASSFAVPCVINDFPSMSPIVKSNGIGVVVDDFSVDGFVNELIKLHKDKSILRAYSQNCITYTKDKLNWAIMEKRLISLYCKVLD